DARLAAALERGLARRILAEASLHNVAEDRFVHLLWLDGGAANRFGGNFCAEFGRGETGEAALEFSDGRADSGENDGSFGVHADLRRSSIARCDTGYFSHTIQLRSFGPPACGGRQTTRPSG